MESLALKWQLSELLPTVLANNTVIRTAGIYVFTAITLLVVLCFNAVKANEIYIQVCMCMFNMDYVYFAQNVYYKYIRILVISNTFRLIEYFAQLRD